MSADQITQNAISASAGYLYEPWRNGKRIIRTHATLEGIKAGNAASIAARNESGIIAADAPGLHAAMRYRAKSHPMNDAFGPLNRDMRDMGPTDKAKLFAFTRVTHLNLFGLPLDTVWAPCYIGGAIFDIWTMDIEHLDKENLGTTPGTTLLACRACNEAKSDMSVPDHRIVQRAIAIGQGVEIPMSNKSTTGELWKLRDRRGNGKGRSQQSTPYAGMCGAVTAL